MTDVRMPKLSDSMESGVIVQWLVEDQSTVEVKADIVEIETDKAIVTHQVDVPGVITLVAEVDQEVPVGELIAVVAEA